jgi:hypothetical protein
MKDKQTRNKPKHITNENRPAIWIRLKRLNTWREIKAEAEKEGKGIGDFICDMWEELKKYLKGV